MNTMTPGMIKLFQSREHGKLVSRSFHTGRNGTCSPQVARALERRGWAKPVGKAVWETNWLITDEGVAAWRAHREATEGRKPQPMNNAYITPSCNIYGFESFDLPPLGWHWETRDGVRWTVRDVPCEMINVYPDENGNGHESPCKNVATHAVYERRQLICKSCLDALVAEDVLSEAETKTITPLFQQTK